MCGVVRGDCCVRDFWHVLSEWLVCVFFFQAEDGIRDLVRSRGLGDVYKRQPPLSDAARDARFKVGPTAPEIGRPSLNQAY